MLAGDMVSITAAHAMTSQEGTVVSITNIGSTWYWVLTGIFQVSSVYFLIQCFTARSRHLPQYYCLSALSCYLLAMGYFAMAARLGWVGVVAEFPHRPVPSGSVGPVRQVYWIRYVAWLLATPLEMTELLLLASAPIDLILLNAFMTVLVMAMGLGGAVIPNVYKWAYYAYGAVACVPVKLVICRSGYKLVKRNQPRMRHMYVLCSSFMVILWSGYGLVWGLCEGANILSPDLEGILYGILDLVSGPIFCLIVAFTASRYLADSTK